MTTKRTANEWDRTESRPSSRKEAGNVGVSPGSKSRQSEQADGFRHLCEERSREQLPTPGGWYVAGGIFWATGDLIGV